jgi:hypothetical protein
LILVHTRTDFYFEYDMYPYQRLYMPKIFSEEWRKSI